MQVSGIASVAEIGPYYVRRGWPDKSVSSHAVSQDTTLRRMLSQHIGCGKHLFLGATRLRPVFGFHGFGCNQTETGWDQSHMSPTEKTTSLQLVYDATDIVNVNITSKDSVKLYDSNALCTSCCKDYLHHTRVMTCKSSREKCPMEKGATQRVAY